MVTFYSSWKNQNWCCGALLKITSTHCKLTFKTYIVNDALLDCHVAQPALLPKFMCTLILTALACIH